MITTFLAYALIGLCWVVDCRLRQSKQATSWARGQYDRGSTILIALAFAISAIALLIAPLCDYAGIGSFSIAAWGWVGVGLIAVSLLLRVWANLTLGALYTRTRHAAHNQRIVQAGPYRIIRHPGYLGIILMWTGAGLASLNWIATLIVLLSMLAVYNYRMSVEESMLAEVKGNEYREYQSRTWRLLPFVY